MKPSQKQWRRQYVSHKTLDHKSVWKLSLGAWFTALMIGLFSNNALAAPISWTVTGPFRNEFIGCSRNATAQVECSIRSAYIGNSATYYGATYFAADSAAYASDSKRYIATKTTLDGRDISKSNVNVSKSKPITVTYTFDFPKDQDKIALLFVDSGGLKNIAIQPYTGRSSVATTSTPAPSQTPSTPPRPDAFDIKLVGCKFNSQGGYSCSGAEIIPILPKK